LLTAANSFVWTHTPVQAVTVTGIWGWHDRWATAWRDSSDTVQDNPLSSGSTTLTVTDADGADSTGETPRFQVGHLLKIDSEYLWVTYQPVPDIAAITLSRAAHPYREPDSAAAAAAAMLDAIAPYRRYPVKI
jgi:hypothetical protein